MKSIKIGYGVLALVSVFLLSAPLHAGVPLNNLEGVGGIAFNPLAYPANSCSDWVCGGDFTVSEAPALPEHYAKGSNCHWATKESMIIKKTSISTKPILVKSFCF
jgi:hypothetical protein